MWCREGCSTEPALLVGCCEWRGFQCLLLRGLVGEMGGREAGVLVASRGGVGHTVATFLFSFLGCIVAGATHPDMKLRHATCKFMAMVVVFVCIRARAMASTSFSLAVARGMDALVRCFGSSITTATMPFLSL